MFCFPGEQPLEVGSRQGARRLRTIGITQRGEIFSTLKKNGYPLEN